MEEFYRCRVREAKSNLPLSIKKGSLSFGERLGRAPIPTKKEVTGCSPSRCAYTVTIERNGFVTDPSAEPKGGRQSVELEAAPEEP